MSYADNAARFLRLCRQIARKNLTRLYGSARKRSRAIVRCRTDCRRRIDADCWGSVDSKGTVMVNIKATAVQRHMEVLAGIVLVAMAILLAVGAVKLFWLSAPV